MYVHELKRSINHLFFKIMRKIIIPVFVLASFTMSAQKEYKKHEKVEVPTEVLESFNKEFNVDKSEWIKEEDNYEVAFEQNKIETTAIYDASGHRKAIEVEAEESDLPAGVIDYVKKNYPSEKIKEFEKITDDNNVVTFEVEVKKEKKSHDVLFDSKGTFLKYE